MGLLANGVLKADIKAAAKLMRYIEEEDTNAIDELKLLYANTGHSHVIGITGLPGSGKSTLIDVMIDYFRSSKKTVGIIAVDPSSPFTGGSFLGDRIRMQKHSFDEGVFIKSLPTKGWRGGISKVTSKMITVMDAMGKDIILVETAGVGQTEVDIKNLVHTTIVVLVGGLGDYIQIIKAGILEIADIFVINKADKNNTEDLESDLKNLFSLGTDSAKDGSENDKANAGSIKGRAGWKPSVYLTEAANNKGVDKLIEGIFAHENCLRLTGKFDGYFRSKSNSDMKEIISDYLSNLLFEKLENDSLYKKLLDDLIHNGSDPYTAAEKILSQFLNFKK
ncbi:MAG: methylmalonyl Co-A mutase-associated GTPase MeaB [Actinobacteria bacterium]|nr:methylmalonyl Co-A mutase-associated GTPase MeaB [Actinomycetota bacterium]